MLFSESHANLPKHQLSEVICQLRFPAIADLRTRLPGEFQQAVCSLFPVFTAKKEAQPPRLEGGPGNFALDNPSSVTNYAFSTDSNNFRINLTENFISLSCSHYTNWKDFSRMLDMPLAAFIQIYKPSGFQRIGLRYLNFISRRQLSLEGTSFCNLITPAFLGPIQLEHLPEQAFSRCSVDSEFLLNTGVRVKLHAGPGFVRRGIQKDPEMKYILDFDLYLSGNLPVSSSAHALEKLHSQAYPLFRSAITKELWDAMNDSL